jgi:SAM-dependent methyltransferase
VARERRLSFGDVAELYDHARPGYPAELVDEVLEFAHAGRGARALEVGAGTGKATVLFADRGLELVALEPSPAMAAVLTRNCEGRVAVTVEQAEFERWPHGSQRFRLLFSAQAWHWINPELRYAHAREALEVGGALALFWNRVDWESCPIREELADAYRRVAPDLGGDAGPGPMHPSNREREWWADWSSELAAAPGFAPPERRRFRWRETYATSAYLEVLRTHSDHIVLGAQRLDELMDAIGAVLDRHGGALPLDYLAELWLARATDDPPLRPG